MPPRKKSGQEAPASGSAARPLHGKCYEVTGTPEGGPEYYAADDRHPLAAQLAALGRASFLAFSPVQELIVHPEGGPAKVLWRFEHGKCTLRPACVIPAQQPA